MHMQNEILQVYICPSMWISLCMNTYDTDAICAESIKFLFVMHKKSNNETKFGSMWVLLSVKAEA